MQFVPHWIIIFIFFKSTWNKENIPLCSFLRMESQPFFKEWFVPKKISDFKRFSYMFKHLLRKCKKQKPKKHRCSWKSSMLLFLAVARACTVCPPPFFLVVLRNMDLLADVFRRILLTEKITKWYTATNKFVRIHISIFFNTMCKVRGHKCNIKDTDAQKLV